MTATAAALELAERQPTTEEISQGIKLMNAQALALEVQNYLDGRQEDKPSADTLRELAKAVLQ